MVPSCRDGKRARGYRAEAGSRSWLGPQADAQRSVGAGGEADSCLLEGLPDGGGGAPSQRGRVGRFRASRGGEGDAGPLCEVARRPVEEGAGGAYLRRGDGSTVERDGGRPTF